MGEVAVKGKTGKEMERKKETEREKWMEKSKIEK